jgi:hypothetical protein
MRRLILFCLIIYAILWVVLRPIPHSAKHDLYIVFPRAKFDEQFGQYRPYDLAILHVDSGIQHTIKVGSVDGERIFITKFGEIVFGDYETTYRTDYRGTKVEKLDRFYGIYNIFSWSPDGKYVIVRDNDFQLFYLYEWRTEKFITLFENLASVSWSPNSDYFTFTLDNLFEKEDIIYVMDVQRLSAIQLLNLSAEIHLGQWSPNQQYFIFYASDRAYIYNFDSKRISYLNSEIWNSWLNNQTVVFTEQLGNEVLFYTQEINDIFRKTFLQQISISEIQLQYRLSPNNKYAFMVSEHPNFAWAGMLCYANLQNQKITCLHYFLYLYTRKSWLLN